MVLAAHSSFAKNDPGRYKTVGQVAPKSAIGDKIFVYLADDTGKYTLYVYTIQQSKEVPETEVSILNQNVSEQTLTFFTCFPIGTTLARWINKAVLTEKLSENQRVTESKTVTTEISPSPIFTTQSTPAKTKKTEQTTNKKTTTTQEHSSAPDIKSTSKKLVTKKSVTTIKPTFKERITYRPVVYRTTIKLVTTV